MKLLFYCLVVASFSSCATYTIPVESFKEQFEKFDNASLREVIVEDMLGKRVQYKTYPMDFVEVVNKNGNKTLLEVKPSLEMRITDSNNRKTVFYFDLIRYEGESISGTESRIRPSSFEKRIPIRAVKKIEIQNGRKKFKYVKGS